MMQLVDRAVQDSYCDACISSGLTRVSPQMPPYTKRLSEFCLDTIDPSPPYDCTGTTTLGE
jgi:hypothetical protein